VTINYIPGYSVNTYDAPNGKYTGSVKHGQSFKAYQHVSGWYAIGKNTWIKDEYGILKQYSAYISLEENYGVNVYDVLNGSYQRRVNGRKYYRVYAEKDG